MPGKGYFDILRLYGPTEAAINKSWKPGDIRKGEKNPVIPMGTPGPDTPLN